MTDPSWKDIQADSEAASNASDTNHYVLQLFVTGVTGNSLRAIANLKEICETYLAGRYTLDVIDLYQQPAEARSHQVFAVPTLIKRLPTPLRRIIGDLSNKEQVLVGLNLKPAAPAARSTAAPRSGPDPA